MKRICAFALAGVLSFSLVGCGEKTGPGTVDPTPSPDITAAPLETPVSTPSAPADDPASTPGQPQPDPSLTPSEPPVSSPSSSEKPAESAAPTESEKPSQKPSEAPGSNASPAPSQQPVASDKPAESEEPVAEFDPKTVYNSVLQAGASSQYDASSMLSVFYDISASDLEWSYLGMPSMSSNIEEIFVARAKDGKAEAVKSACQTRLEDLQSDAETYPETGTYVSDAKIETVGNWVLLYVGPNAATAVKNFQDSLK